MTFREARLGSGLTVDAAAKKYKLSPSTIKRMDAGGKMSTKTLAKILHALPLQTQLILYERFIQDAKQKNHLLVLPILNELKKETQKQLADEGLSLKLAA